MNDLRKMLDEFKNKYVYIQVDEHSAIVNGDNDLIHKIDSKEEEEMTDEKILFDYAKELKEYCSNQSCVNCVFCVLSSDGCVLDNKYPRDWRIDKISVIGAVKLLKEMRYNALNATQYDDRKREAKAEALKMAIEALGGKDDD